MTTPSRAAVARAIAAHLVEKGWRFRRGSTAPWIPPDEPAPDTTLPTRPPTGAAIDEGVAGYSLLGAAGYQAELERRLTVGERQAS